MADYLRDGGEEWFVVLPDREDALPVATKMRPYACREIRHVSGRPWLLGRWRDQDVGQAAVGSAQAVVIGEFPVTTGLGRYLDRARTSGDLDRVARELPGCFSLIASIDGQVRVQGSVSGVRRVFHTTVGGVAVASDRADVLAVVADAEVDEEQIALRLLYPKPPHPLSDSALWRGIRGVSGDSYLLLAGSGAAHTVRWWSPPEPGLPLADGAVLLRDALTRAVDARTAGVPVLSSDMSGGLDSTSLCFLAARSGARLHTVTVDWDEAGNEDARWAALAAEHLPDIHRLVVPSSELPPFFDDVAEVGPPRDEPHLAVHDRARRVATASRFAELGSRMHLSGFGGDEVLHAPVSYLHDLARRRPTAAWSRARAHRARLRWTWGDTLRGLLDRRSYARWLVDGARAVDQRSAVLMTAGDWAARPKLPPWATPDAAGLVGEMLLRAADDARPLAATREQHGSLEHVRAAAGVSRALARAVGRVGVPVSFPYLDDRVVEACLAVRGADRTTPWEFKPLLREALGDLVPRSLLARRTKDHCTTEALRGLHRRRRDVTELCADSLLAQRGLINPDALRTALLNPAPATLPLAAVSGTLAAERWLREVSTARGSRVPEPSRRVSAP